MNKLTSGFTLIELMITLVIIAIGLAFTLPAMQEFTNSNRQSELINRIVRDFNYAKSEAVTRGESVTIARTGSTAGDWYDGWEVTTAAGTKIRETSALTVEGFTLTAGTVNSITFRPTGATASNKVITLTLCDTKTTIPNIEKQLDVTKTGRITLNGKYTCP